MSDSNQTIIVIDDDRPILVNLEMVLLSDGFESVKTFLSGIEGLEYIRTGKGDVVLLDLNLPEISGLEILKTIKKERPLLPVIIITGQSDVATAVEIMKNGAFDYLAKPNDIGRVSVSVQNALKMGELRSSFNLLKRQFFKDDLDRPEAFSSIITENPAMYKIFHYMEAIRHTSQPVLITGETGVGKELFARAFHTLCGCEGEFIPLDVSFHDNIMLTDALFGHIKGAYTGAEDPRGGLVKAAKGGALFLDEIGDLSLEAQSVLLRFIQEREFRQGGDDRLQYSDARIILATNRDLQAMVYEGKFRKDLYYRLETHNINIPPLRKRFGDIVLLAEHFVSLSCKDLSMAVPKISAGFIKALEGYSFPGNVRELQNMIHHAVTMSGDELLVDSLADRIAVSFNSDHNVPGDSYGIFDGEDFPTLKEAEERLVQEALKRTDNHQGRAAELLGISRQALNKRIRIRSEAASE
ncbi:MAG: sigma-54-dependent Fis family transcriptional regulator [Spirochaetales bacterium]|nr:sigma-54-dependent Fis family transcriptional regulator [Spirochaetales bacterium]